MSRRHKAGWAAKQALRETVAANDEPTLYGCAHCKWQGTEPDRDSAEFTWCPMCTRMAGLLLARPDETGDAT